MTHASWVKIFWKKNGPVYEKKNQYDYTNIVWSAIEKAVLDLLPNSNSPESVNLYYWHIWGNRYCIYHTQCGIFNCTKVNFSLNLKYLEMLIRYLTVSYKWYIDTKFTFSKYFNFKLKYTFVQAIFTDLYTTHVF